MCECHESYMRGVVRLCLLVQVITVITQYARSGHDCSFPLHDQSIGISCASTQAQSSPMADLRSRVAVVIMVTLECHHAGNTFSEGPQLPRLTLME